MSLSAANLRGDLLSALAGLLYTGYLILVERTRGEVQPMPLLFLASLFASVFLFPAALVAGDRIIPADWGALFALALCSQVAGQGLLVYALGHLPPLVVGITMLAQPALSALLGYLYYGEAFTALDWAGAAAIVQPGGSNRDEEVIAAANRLGVPMLLTGKRHFRH